MRIGVVICAIAASVFLGSPVWAALHNPEDHEIDQYQEDQNYGYAVGDTTLMGQTFTVGLPGLLCHIEIGNTSETLYGEPSAPVVQIRNTVEYESGLFRPGSDILGSVTLTDPVPINGWTQSIDFMPYNIQVEPGETYAIVVYADGYTGAVSVGATANAAYVGSQGNNYGGGELWTYTDDGYGNLAWLDDPYVYDMQFRTYVQAVVPLPAGVWLGICAVGVAGWHLKRQRG